MPRSTKTSEEAKMKPVTLLTTFLSIALALLLALAGDASAAEGCPNAGFRTGPSAALPDCRAYELVTPAEKNGARVIVDNGGVQGPGTGGGIAADGESVRLHAEGAFAGAESLSGVFPAGIYLARRTSSGWATASLDPPASRFLIVTSGEFGEEVPSSLGNAAVWLMRGASQPENSIGLYLVGLDGAPLEVGPALPPTAPNEEPFQLTEDIRWKGVSADGSRVFFTLTKAYWPFETAENRQPGTASPLLEYVGTGNREPLQVGVDDEGKPVDECPAQAIGGQSHNDSFNSPWTQNAVSANGEVVFFTDLCKFQLFARVENGLPGAHTVAISEPTKADCAGCAAEGMTGSGSFDGASEDGSKVFFTRSMKVGSNTYENVYEYDFDAPEGQRVIRVTSGDGTVAEPSPELRGVVQVSPDGTHVYFVAGGVLTTNRNYAGLSAQPGANNLYLYERDAQYPGGRTVFIATLAPSDSELWGAKSANSDVTPDGRFLVFISHALLTADDSSAEGQVFEYDAQANTMVRVSKGQGGYDNDGNSNSREEPQIAYPSAYSLRQYVPAAYSERLTVSADGSYVFFASPVALTPQALSFAPLAQEAGRVAFNVYEYRAGNVYLISDGQDTSEASALPLVGTDPSGRDVLLNTTDPLVAQDQDGNVDVYDARIDGGFPAPPSPAECAGDACQGSLGAAPVLLSPGSEFQRGGENLAGTVPTTSTLVVTHPKVKRKSKSRARRKRRKAKRSSSRARGSRAHGVRGRS